MSQHAGTTVRFDEHDLNLFSAASGDCNPLHMSAAYASRTVYGDRVVFGALGALACLGQIDVPPGSRIVRLTADFHRPLFMGVEYRTTISRQPASHTVRMFDGSVPVLTCSVSFSEVSTPNAPASTVHFERSCAREWNERDIETGLEIEGQWRANPEAMAQLEQRWSIRSDSIATESLLWSSYFIGMELPGRRALFFRVVLSFSGAPVRPDLLAYKVTVLAHNPRISQLRMSAELQSGCAPVVSGQMVSFVRPELASSDADALTTHAAASGALDEKIALVIGASRGLGAAVAGALAMHGARVVATSRSSASITSGLPPHAAGRIATEHGDAADTHWLEQLRDRILRDHGRLDLLICNAFPAIPALRLEANALTRIQAYLSHSTSLVLTPLCVFLELLNQSGGCAVTISSSAVEKPVREWPHYVAAKTAIEALTRVAALQYPEARFLIVRPERLRTEMTNTPMARQQALPPSTMAALIVSKLIDPPPPGSVAVLSNP